MKKNEKKKERKKKKKEKKKFKTIFFCKRYNFLLIKMASYLSENQIFFNKIISKLSSNI